MSSRPALPAGLRLDARKTAPLQHPLRAAPAPHVAVLALDQGSGEAAEPIVAVGTRVGVGTPIARAVSSAATDLHSPVAGVVVEVATQSTVAGVGRCILIENDATDARDPALVPVDWRALDGVTLLDRLRGAGIAGLGGAAFPTAGKLTLARASAVAHLILNGAECEPWICCDDALMRERAADVVLGGQVMLAACGATRCTIAIEDDKPEAATAIAAAIAAARDDRVELVELPAIYPLGAERQLIEAVTGREVPHDALPPADRCRLPERGHRCGRRAVRHHRRTGRVADRHRHRAAVSPAPAISRSASARRSPSWSRPAGVTRAIPPV